LSYVTFVAPISIISVPNSTGRSDDCAANPI
jgi:hypothetical protein